MNEKLEDTKKLKEFMSSVPNGELSDFIDRIQTVCKIRRTVYFNWRAGRTAIPSDCKKKIEQLAGQKIWGE